MTIHFTDEMVDLWLLISPFFGQDVEEDAPENIRTAWKKFKELYQEQYELELRLQGVM